MPSSNSASTGTPSTPFEWLSGGLLSFGKKPKSTTDNISNDVSSLIKETYETLQQLQTAKESENDNNVSSIQSLEETLASNLSRIRLWLYEERMSSSSSSNPDPTTSSTIHTSSSQPPTIAVAVVNTLITTLPDFVPNILQSFQILPFESRKDVASILNYLLICGLEGSDASIYAAPVMTQFVQYVETKFVEIINVLMTLHDQPTPDMALHGGSIFRSILKHVSLYQMLVTSNDHVTNYVYPFLDKFVHSPNFDMSIDAMESLRMLMTGGVSSSGQAPPAQQQSSESSPQDEELQLQLQQQQQIMQQLAAECLIQHYPDIFEQRFNPKLLDYKYQMNNTNNNAADPTSTTTTTNNNNYMIRRMALQILSTVLLTRSFYQVMIQYIACKNNLRLVMNLLRDSSPHITLDAFHVFKIFVANPQKPPDICQILKNNQVKLCTYLETLHKDREVQDVQFRDEKALVISTLQNL